MANKLFIVLPVLMRKLLIQRYSKYCIIRSEHTQFCEVEKPSKAPHKHQR